MVQVGRVNNNLARISKMQYSFSSNIYFTFRLRYMGIIINITFHVLTRYYNCLLIFTNDLTVNLQNIQKLLMFMIRAASLPGPGGSLRSRSSLLTEMTFMSKADHHRT